MLLYHVISCFAHVFSHSFAAATQDFVYAIVRPRHADEAAKLLSRQWDERASCMRRAAVIAADDRRGATAALFASTTTSSSAHCENIDSQTLQPTNSDGSDVAAAFSALNARLVTAADSAHMAELDALAARHGASTAALRRRHADDIATALAVIVPGADAARIVAAEEAAAAAQLASLKSTLAADRIKALSALRAAQGTAAIEIQERAATEMAALEAEHAQTLSVERARLRAAERAAAARVSKDPSALYAELNEDSARLETLRTSELRRQRAVVSAQLAVRHAARVARTRRTLLEEDKERAAASAVDASVEAHAAALNGAAREAALNAVSHSRRNLLIPTTQVAVHAVATSVLGSLFEGDVDDATSAHVAMCKRIAAIEHRLLMLANSITE